MVVMQTRLTRSSCVRLQVLDVVQLGELAAVVGRDELLELLQRLVAEVGAVDEEEDAARAGELDQPVDEVDGGEGLAAAGGHLDQARGVVGGERLLEVADGFDLRGPEIARRHLIRSQKIREARVELVFGIEATRAMSRVCGRRRRCGFSEMDRADS